MQATVDLHREVGPVRTTVAEIARRAGVQRLTVYNHFPDDAALFGACQARWIQLHPLPDLAAALAHDQPVDRIRAALLGYYRWYRETAPMAEWSTATGPRSPPSTNSCNAPPTPDSISLPANSPQRCPPPVDRLSTPAYSCG